MSPRGTFDHQLNTLAHRVVRMGSLVDEAIELSLSALLERNAATANRVLTDDDTINRLRFDIEEDSYAIFALQQPLARDLRIVAAAITAAVNLERIGDHAVAVAVLARRLSGMPELQVPQAIQEMGEMGRSMLRRALDAYISYDATVATAVAKDDVRLNHLKDQCVQTLITTMSKSPEYISQGTYLIWVSHRLERIGDCIKNICERTVYITTNELFDFDTDDSYDEFDMEGTDLLEPSEDPS